MITATLADDLDIQQEIRISQYVHQNEHTRLTIC